LIDVAAKTIARDVAATNKSFAMDLEAIGSLLGTAVDEGPENPRGSKPEGSLREGFRGSLQALRRSERIIRVTGGLSRKL
jgi:hypothetical protein